MSFKSESGYIHQVTFDIVGNILTRVKQNNGIWKAWQQAVLKTVNTTSNGRFNNIWITTGCYEIFIFDIEDVNKWIKLIYTTNGDNIYTLFKVNNVTLDVSGVTPVGTIEISGGSGNLKAISTVYN